VYNNDPGKEKALLFAAKSGDTAKARSLVEEGTNVNVRDDSVYHLTPLITAAMCDYVEVVQVLLEGGANLEDPASASGNTALHQAASAGSLEACRLLLDEGANVDALNFSKNTPLHLAAVNGHMPVVKLLVERGADVRRKNVLNDTPREGVGKRKEGCGKMVVFDTLYAKFSLGVFALQNTLLQKSFFCQNKADRHSASFFSYE
jgi:ankyrin repeat protein